MDWPVSFNAIATCSLWFYTTINMTMPTIDRFSKPAIYFLILLLSFVLFVYTFALRILGMADVFAWSSFMYIQTINTHTLRIIKLMVIEMKLRESMSQIVPTTMKMIQTIRQLPQRLYASMTPRPCKRTKINAMIGWMIS